MRANCSSSSSRVASPEIDGHVLINDMPDGFDVKTGDFLNIEITDAHEYDLVARVVIRQCNQTQEG